MTSGTGSNKRRYEASGSFLHEQMLGGSLFIHPPAVRQMRISSVCRTSCSSRHSFMSLSNRLCPPMWIAT